jgi:hypothetical protein
LGESPTHFHIKLALAESLKKFGYETSVEKHFEGGRMDVHALNNETGEELEIEIFVTNMPNRFVVRVVAGKLMGIDYELEQLELAKKKAVWQQLQEEQKPILYRERDQYNICAEFLNLITSGHIQLESRRILDTLNDIFSHLRRKRTW